MDTEEGFSNALSFANMARAANIPASFYVLSFGCQTNPISQCVSWRATLMLAITATFTSASRVRAASAQERRLFAMRAPT